MDSTLSVSAEQVAPIKRPLAIANWLLAVAALVFLMVVVGGITRLTESGLSITEWKPVTGAIPPLTQADWSHAFDLYKQTPEYREINGPAGMTLAQFQFIFFWEWLHRLIGRLIGVAFAVPLLWFAAKRAIPQGYGWKLVGLLVLGGLQGVLGWYMVMSGLVDRTDVSHFRLSAHLLLAFAIMGALIWVALDLRQLARTGEDRPARLKGAAVATMTVLFVQLLFGAWVAGLNAGQVANDWPLMQGRLFPEGVDWSNGRLVRADSRPLPNPLHPSLVGMGHGRRFGRLRAPRPHPGRWPEGFGGYPLGVRYADPARHSDRADRGRDLACRASPGGRRAGRRFDGVGRPCPWAAGDNERRHRLLRLRQCRGGRAHRPDRRRGRPRGLHQHPWAVPLHLSLARRDRDGRGSARDPQDQRRSSPTR